MAKDKHPRETLWEMIKDIRYAMITHVHLDGRLRACPMTTANREGMNEDQNLYFLIAKDSMLGHCLAKPAQINVAYSNPEEDSYVSIAAFARLSDDMALKEKLFSPMAKSWFPEGPTDPNLTVLVARAEHAEYWDVKQNKIVQLFTMAKAAVTGEPPKDMGDHQEIRL